MKSFLALFLLTGIIKKLVLSIVQQLNQIPTVLMLEYFEKGHALHTGNYYSSPSLALHFLNNSTHLCGTVRTKRKMYSKKSPKYL